jgi:gas vesicle protein
MNKDLMIKAFKIAVSKTKNDNYQLYADIGMATVKLFPTASLYIKAFKTTEDFYYITCKSLGNGTIHQKITKEIFDELNQLVQNRINEINNNNKKEELDKIEKQLIDFVENNQDDIKSSDKKYMEQVYSLDPFDPDYRQKVYKLINLKLKNQMIDEDSYIDWNFFSMDDLANYLENKYQFNSSGEALAIMKMVKFYREHK